MAGSQKKSESLPPFRAGLTLRTQASGKQSRCWSRLLDLRRRDNVRNRTQIAWTHIERDHGWPVVSSDRDGRLAPASIQDRVRRSDAGALVLLTRANFDQHRDQRLI